MDKNQIIEYVLNSPENTNPAILGQMIDEVAGSEPTGTIDITSNGYHNVTNYSLANVHVPTYTKWNGSVTVTNTDNRSALVIRHYDNQGNFVSKTLYAGKSYTIPCRTWNNDGTEACVGEFWVTSGITVSNVPSGVTLKETSVNKAEGGTLNYVDFRASYLKEFSINLVYNITT